MAFSNFSLAETDLVLAEKDAVGKFAAAAATFFVRRSENHARQAATYSPLFGNRIATKVQIFALT